MPKYRNSIFAVVDPQIEKEDGEKNTKHALHHLGFEDSVLNHLLLIRDIEKN
jgi:hypothetical protein